MYSQLKLITSNKSTSKVIFAVFCLILFILNYPYLLNYPTGIHFIRQTDSISFSLYYLHNNNFNFFDIGNLNLDFRNGKTACEFPLFYYLYFILFKIFGVNYSLIRWVSLLLSCVSIYVLLNGINTFLKNYCLSIFVVLIVISSSVYRYYSINFLPDSIAISFVFIGISYIFKFNELKSDKVLYYSLIFLTIAALLKIYYGIYLLLAFSLILINKIENKKKFFFTFLICNLFILFWYSYSIYYNHINNANYYLTKFAPIWQMKREQINFTTSMIVNYWYTKYFFQTVFHFFFVIIIISFLPQINKKNKLKTFLLICLFVNLVYVLFFYRQFKDHDYYFMPLITMFLFFTTYTLNGIILLFNNNKIKIMITVIIGIIAVLGYNYSSLNIKRRFYDTLDPYSRVTYQLINCNKFLDSLHVKPTDKFLVIGDATVNGSLVLLNRFGYTYKNFTENDSLIKQNIKKVNYLLVLSPSKNKLPEYIKQKLTKSKIYYYNSNNIYSLSP